MKILYWFMLLSIMSLCYASRLNVASQKIPVKKRLSPSKKIPLKTIKSPDGDIIDCIDIYHQPAFDHPLLKNHTIMMKPSSYPKRGQFVDSKMVNFTEHGKEEANQITQLWHLKESCPQGTIPIRRTKKEDFLIAGFIKSYGKMKHESIPHTSSAYGKLSNQAGEEHATVSVGNNRYFGAETTVNVWKPHVQTRSEFSTSQIWITSGSDSNLDSIEAGWIVYPDKFGDDNPRTFTYWTSDGNPGCYNLLCTGFIQVHHKVALGAALKPISTYHGRQFQIAILIWKDKLQGGWWLQFGNDKPIGYWPTSLFSQLTQSASMVKWGGVVLNTQEGGQHTTTGMGSGHFPEEKFGGASFFKDLQVVDDMNYLRPPGKLGQLSTNVDKPNCYNLELSQSRDWGDHFYYGGPGRNPNCP